MSRDELKTERILHGVVVTNGNVQWRSIRRSLSPGKNHVESYEIILNI